MNITDAEKATTSTKKTSSDEDLTENEHPLLMGINPMKVVFKLTENATIAMTPPTDQTARRFYAEQVQCLERAMVPYQTGTV